MIELLPDLEQIVSTFLRAQPEVGALVADRVYTEFPRDKTFPLVIVSRQGGAPAIGYPLYLDSAIVNVQCYAGPIRTAWQVAETCRAVMSTRILGTHRVAGTPVGVVTGIDFGALLRSRDPDVTDANGNAYVRVIFDTQIWAHP